MESIKRLLELREKIKSKKPIFIRRDTNKKKRLEKVWRRPTGLHSKLRGRFSGRPKRVAMGYRSPKKVRGMHKSGLQQYVISSIKDLERLDAKKIGLVISSSLGDRKRIVMLKKAKELGFDILNIKNPDEYLREVEDKINLRRNAKKKEDKTKAVKVEKKEEKKENEAESGEEKKETEKKEKDKVLIKRDI